MTQSIWLAEAQSSQRDMLLSLQTMKAQFPERILRIWASHRHDRPEILREADATFIEPDDKDEQSHSVESRPQTVFEQCQQHGVSVLLTGRNGIDYEPHRKQFEQAGIRLLTGAKSVQDLQDIDDKSAFIKRCQANDIPVATGWRFETMEQLQDLLAKHSNQPLCVKPVIGIFAQGFWRLDTGRASTEQYDSFEHLYYTDRRKVHLQQFLSAYEQSQMIGDKRIAMLLMPYLSGQEYSIDVVCEHGDILGAVTRHKVGSVQHVGFDEAVMDVVIPLIREFGCDGIVSVQTKADEVGKHQVLEINSRPSGGIGYTVHSGLDLTQLAFAYWLGWTDRPTLASSRAKITACKVRPLMTAIKID